MQEIREQEDVAPTELCFKYYLCFLKKEVEKFTVDA